MYRPGGFPEFNPKQQKVFDAILAVITKVFEQHNFSRIWTPAVEPVEILKKGGDIVDKQVFGLYGLAQGVEDVKDYALHFDLTIPLARYILDNRNDLTFPFKRYQMQPVWRGERTKRGRFKEFRQFDADVTWPSESNVGVRYDIETVAVMSKVMDSVCREFNITINNVLKISHIGLTKSFLASFKLDDETINQVLNLLDNYYKADHAAFVEKLSAVAPSNVCDAIYKLIETKDINLMKEYEKYDDMNAILNGLKGLNVPYEYDICIVRGHNYYRGMVCERFEKEDVSFGSLAAGGRYDNITDFIDKKQSFSGVGTSLGRFVYLAIEKIGELPAQESYMFVNFEDTLPEVLALYNKFLSAGKIVDLYPTAAKIGKQFEYADKKGVTHVVVLGTSELQKKTFKLKDLQKGTEKEYDMVDCYGAIVFHDNKVLLVQNHPGGRGFPKGKGEKGESIDEALHRELEEETGIKKIKPLSDAIYQTSYFYDNGEPIFKSIQYKAFNTDSDKVKLQTEELATYKRATSDEAKKLLPVDMHHLIDSIKQYF